MSGFFLLNLVNYFLAWSVARSPLILESQLAETSTLRVPYVGG